MKLSLRRSYLSIKEFPDTELPKFTLITGLNGVGKTHLLKGMLEGHIAVDLAPDPQNEIRLYDWTTLAPADTGAFDGAVLLQERNRIAEMFLGQTAVHAEIVLDVARRFGLQGAQLRDIETLTRMTVSELTNSLGTEERAKQAHQAIQRAAHQASNTAFGAPSVREFQNQIESIARAVGFLSFPPDKLQPIVDSVQRLVLGLKGEGEVAARGLSAYLGGFELMLYESYLKIDDHDLEAMVLEAFPGLKNIARDRSGALIQHIADSVIRDRPQFVPRDLYATFLELLSAPSHLA